VATFETTKLLLLFLQAHAGEKFKSIDIAEKLVTANPVEAEEKRVLSSVDLSGRKLTIQVQAEISSRKSFLLRKYPEFTVTEGRPGLYSWNPSGLMSEDKDVSQFASEFSEQSLYPKLALFLEGSGVHAMRIDEKTSRSKRGAGANHWRHPDLAAIQYLPTDWDSTTQGLGKHFQASLLKFLSFEVKTRLTIGNVREAFFQAVSNSSWANFAYLVAASIDSRARDELEVLSKSHGVGVILLSHEEPLESEFLFPAAENAALDWSSIDILVSENKDFAEFIHYCSLVADTKTLAVALPVFQKSLSQ
jgi:uncharacterized protein|tara:strand:- start:692 stop:1606 length:915 start_codon:yes stop_codon:yes gene_type:complete